MNDKEGTAAMENLKYPVGRFTPETPMTPERRKALIDEIGELPERLRGAVSGLSDRQLDTPYRPGGWTVRQVVHHVADSHINAYVRFKLAVTEKEPTIKPYEEKLWAELPEAKNAPPDLSLVLLETLHRRWAVFLRQLAAADFERTIHHPVNGMMNLDVLLGLYAWHGRHHVAHITELKKRERWI